MLYNEILTKAGTSLLRVLCRCPYKEFYPSELAKKAEISITHTIRLIKILKNQNVITIRKSGRHELFKLNLENLVAKKFLELFHLERRLEIKKEFRAGLEEFVRNLEKNKHIVSIILFGSVAKGIETRESDIDLMIITDKVSETKKAASDLIEDLFGFYRYLIEEHIYTKENFDSFYRKGNDMIINLIKDGIILYDSGFYQQYLKRELPLPTQEHIEETLNFAKRNFKEAESLIQTNYESAVIPLKNVVRDCCRAILLMKGFIPGSKHELPDQIKKINPEYSKLLKDINKIYIKHMEKAEKIEKKIIIKYLNKTEDLLKESLELFGVM